MPTSTVWVFGLLMALFGLLIAFMGWNQVRQHRNRLQTWRPGRARVTGYTWSSGGDGNSLQHWQLERTDANGVVHKTTSQMGTTWGTLRSFPFEVDIVVNPEDESQFALASGARSGAGGVAFVLAGLVFAIFGTMLVITGWL
ncbi:DUF3592 domain-containing protein [Aestuariimicrobium ganziense]|uniref:DUF3592 domain-containing protein n=1 Tax=Aestuariimicrobium ganziense TaxID=2773677 RepID=UPI001940D89F|nr:DUF3592 domain-containing protein [Aestuariimicrobium ganziense]